MKIQSIQNCTMCNNFKYQSKVNRQGLMQNYHSRNIQPSFKGCNVFKVIGFVGGAIACAIAAPAVAAIGLAGLGAIPGMVIGDVVDKKIDKLNGEDSDD